MVSYQNQTKNELQEKLRERDLSSEGTKKELIQRLEEDDAAEGEDGSGGGKAATGHREPQTNGQDPSAQSDDGTRPPSEARLKAPDAIRRASEQLREFGGRKVAGVAGVERMDGGWRVLVEVVEVERVPSSTDVLGEYEVTVDDQGEMLGYERLQRYVRAQAGGHQSE